MKKNFIGSIICRFLGHWEWNSSKKGNSKKAEKFFKKIGGRVNMHTWILRKKKFYTCLRCHDFIAEEIK